MTSGALRERISIFISCIFYIAIILTASGCRQKKTGTWRSADLFTDTKFSAEEFSERIQDKWGNLPDSVCSLVGLYRANEWYPMWVGEDGECSLAESLVSELDSLRWDGLDPERYERTSLLTLLDSFKSGAHLGIENVINLDTLLTHAYILAARHLLFGLLRPRSVDSLWFHSNDSIFQIAHLIPLTRDLRYPSLDTFRSRTKTYASLQVALRHYINLASDTAFLAAKEALGRAGKRDSLLSVIIRREPVALPELPFDSLPEERSKVGRYQYYYGLFPTGTCDSTTTAFLKRRPDSVLSVIQANLERMRWLPRAFEDSFLIVNIPQMELRYLANGMEMTQMRVVVGKPARQTPTLDARITNIVFNPSWGVPPTILKKDVIPGVERSGVSYLTRKGLRVFDRKGNPVDATQVTGENYRRFLFKQPPGDNNALGYVKFNLPNKWDIYLHDTPHREDFKKRFRALSSGCIRVAQPRALASFILVDINGRNRFTEGYIDTLIDKKKSHWEVLRRKIPVHIVYLTAFDWTNGEGLRFAKDIYQRDQRIMAKMPSTLLAGARLRGPVQRDI